MLKKSLLLGAVALAMAVGAVAMAQEAEPDIGGFLANPVHN